MMAMAFEALRVLDLSTEIVGPFATRMLADAGADVIKVEAPTGDPLRGLKTSAVMGQSDPLAEGEDGALFQWLNASKRSVVLDLESGEGREALLGLVASADLVIESFAPGHLEGLGLGIESLQARNPQVSLISISPYGQDGPWRNRPATEFTLQAETGSLSGRGYDDLGPVAAGGRLGEFAVGPFAAVAGATAWRTARARGRGQHVDISMLETMLLCFQPYQYIQGQMRPGELMPAFVEVPSIEPCKDGMVGFSTQTSQQWHDLLTMIGRPDLIEDKDLNMGFTRYVRRDELMPIIQEWTRAHRVDEVVELASLMRIPVAPIGNGDTVLETDQMQERGFYVDHPAGFKVPGVPYRLGVGETRPLGPAPKLGAHTESVLGDGHAFTQETAPAAGGGEGGPLAGLRVVDFTAFWAGPFAASSLAALGAEVIKIESIQRPDGMRFASGFLPDDGMVWEWAPVFHGANSGKQAITLNLESDEGLAHAKELVRGADIVIENFSPRVMERFGLDEAGMKALNPDAVLVRMPAFGLTGPWRDRAGFAMTIEQAAGLAWVTGFSEREPIVPRGVCDPVGGITAVFGLLCALELRAAGAGGQQVEVPLLEVGLTLAGEQVVEKSAYGVRLDRRGNDGPVAAPQGVYRCLDPRNEESKGWIAIAVGNDTQWAALVAALGAPAWVRDPAYASEAGRRSGRVEIDAGIAAFCGERDGRELADALAAAGVPAGLLHNQRNVVPGQTQMDARGFLAFLDHSYAGRLGYPKFPLRYDGEYLERTLPPTLGEHNEAVLSRLLGLGPEQIEELREQAIIGTRPSFL
jgi:crotonobetainyl-CoA:carnitine CoA-transferase CaiB-like acyl-CoA transferase